MILKYKQILKKFYFRYFSGNKIKVAKKSRLRADNAILKHCEIYINGRDCLVELGRGNVLDHCKIVIYADKCKVTLGSDNVLNHAILWLEDDNSMIKIGNHNRFTGKIQLSAIEGRKVIIDNDCLFSSEIYISTGDSHSILDIRTHSRINHSSDIHIENHVWVGHRASILKGSHIAPDTIVGESSVVTKSFEESNTAIAGIPAKIVKRNVSWDILRI